MNLASKKTIADKLASTPLHDNKPRGPAVTWWPHDWVGAFVPQPLRLFLKAMLPFIAPSLCQWSTAILGNYVISCFWYFHQSQKYKCFMMGNGEFPVIVANVREIGVESQSCLLSTQRDKSWREDVVHGPSCSPDCPPQKSVLLWFEPSPYKICMNYISPFYYISFIQIACTLQYKLLNFPHQTALNYIILRLNIGQHDWLCFMQAEN